MAACSHSVCRAQPDPAGAHLDVPKTVVAKLVHKTVQEGGGSPGIHSEFPLRCEIVGLLGWGVQVEKDGSIVDVKRINK